MTGMWRFRALICLLWFALQKPVSIQPQMESALPVNAGTPDAQQCSSWTFHGTVCLGYNTASCADLMVVLVELEPLQFKPIKKPAPHSNLWKFSGCCTFGTMTSKTGKQFRKLEKAVAVSGVFAGVLQESRGKIPGKYFPESPNATNSRISGTGKGKPAGNLGSTLPGPCHHLPCGVFFEIDSSSLLEFF